MTTPRLICGHRLLVGSLVFALLSACTGEGSEGFPAASSQGDAAANVAIKALSSRYAVTRITVDGVADLTASRLTEAGQVLGYYRDETPTSVRRVPFHWTPSGGGQLIRGLPGDAEISMASSDGTVVGTTRAVGQDESRPFVLRQGRGEPVLLRNDLAGLTPPYPGIRSGRAHVVTEAGVVGGAVGYPAARCEGGVSRPVYWAPPYDQEPVLLGSAPGQNGIGAVTHGNRAGQLAGRFWNESGGGAAFVWSEAGGTVVIDPSWDSEVTDVGEGGHVVGRSNQGDGLDGRRGLSFQPFIWTAGGGKQALPGTFHNVLGGNSAAVARVSRAGAVIVTGSLGAPDPSQPVPARRPYYWTASGGEQDILGAAGEEGGASEISDDGVVVGWFRPGSGPEQSAFAWSPTEGFVNLNDRIDPASGIHLDRAIGVTDAGFILAEASDGWVLLSPAVQTAAPVAGPIDVSDPAAASTSISFSVGFTDPDAGDSHTASWDWGDGNTGAGAVVFNSGSGTVTGAHAYAAAGIYDVKLNLVDSSGNQVSATRKVVIYDANAGRVVGAGQFTSPAGAFKARPEAVGRADFTFLAQYTGNRNRPTGATVFRFRAGDLTFTAVSNDWLVIHGNRATLQGGGRLAGGSAQARFAMTVLDIDDPARWWQNADRIRMRIWSDAGVLYDNQIDPAGEGTATEGTQIVTGAIEILAR